MKNHILLLAVAILMLSGCNGSRTIKTEVPARPAGQEDMLGFAAEPIDTVRVGFVGLGMRGPGAVERFTHIPGAKVVALCDVLQDRVESSNEILTEAGFPAAAEYYGDTESYKALCERDDIDLVYICTDWIHHVPVALYAMEHGKHAAIEVPSAASLEDIWALVNTSERTRKHCIQLENCCYDFFEINTLNMAQHGVFGEILHVEGAYIHNLQPFWDEYWNNWRLDFNQTHRGDVYPTHGLGPVCQLLDIHRGDRMTTLVAMDTKAVTGPELVKERTGEDVEFLNGDHTMTMIRTENGKTIQIQHDVMNPRPYNRMYQLTGTKGFANKYPRQGYSFGHGFCSQAEADSLVALYTHPIVREVGELAKEVGGHGGMDYIMDYRLVYCLRNGLPLDMDVYDLAEWCCVVPLSAISIENGSAPVEVPDFTRGGWNKIQGYRHAYAE